MEQSGYLVGFNYLGAHPVVQSEFQLVISSFTRHTHHGDCRSVVVYHAIEWEITGR
jgi:hypothetical protein